MQNGRHREHWLRPCDLCGSLRYEQVLDGAAPLVRCRDCGLVQDAEETGERTESAALDSTLFETALKQVTRRIEGVANPKVLIIGRPPESSLSLVRESGMSITLLVGHHETEGLDGLALHKGSLDSAPFRADQFDVILCALELESLDSTTTLFAKARLWLAPGGLFFVGGANWGSLTRRLWSRRWRERHPSGQVFADRRHLKEYAARHGFERISSGTRSGIEEVAAITFGLSSPPSLVVAAALPVWLAASLPGLGDTWWSLLCKRGYAVRPVLKRLEDETERAPGLAAAGYSSARRESIDVER